MRAVVPLLIPFAFLFGIARRWKSLGNASGVVPTLLFGSLCIWVQPLLAGPYITRGSGPRLVTLALLPLWLALAIKLRDAGAFIDASSSRRLPWVIALLALASMHHLCVSPRIPFFGQRALFATVHALACAGLFLITLLERRHDLQWPPWTA